MLVAVILSVPVYAAGKTKKVLFIGNSLTSMNDLPGMVALIANSHGDKLIYDSYTPGGKRLKDHAADPTVAQKIQSQPWDYVVLQEQSQYPAFREAQLARDVYPYAQQLTQMVRMAHAETQVVFYMGMAHRDGDEQNKSIYPELATYEETQNAVNRCYRTLAEQNSALVAPVGELWQALRRARPDINIYADKTHPSLVGTYLAASVFYRVLFNVLSENSWCPANVDKAQALYIQQMADQSAL